jgi:transcriptional regulator GlxA family with amidase domain
MNVNELLHELNNMNNKMTELLNMVEQYQQEMIKVHEVAQRLDVSNPTLPLAFTGTPSERITRQLKHIGIDYFQ